MNTRALRAGGACAALALALLCGCSNATGKSDIVIVAGLPAPIVTAAGESTTSILVSWSPVSGAVGYNLYRKDNTPYGGDYSRIAENTAAISYTDSTIVPGVTYTFVASALDGSSEGNWSSPASAQSIPGIPANLTATQTSTGIYIQFDAVDGSNSYRVYRNAPGFMEHNGSFSDVSGAKTLHFTDTGLTYGVTYTYQVAAEVGNLLSARSASASATAP